MNKPLTLLLAILITCPALALAKPAVTINMQAEKEIVVVEDGQKKTKIVPATEIAPGETIIYKLAFVNTGDEAATKVQINNPLPEGTVYLPDTASKEIAKPAFSIDGGKTYDQPQNLVVEKKQADGSLVKREARPGEYTHIRWIIERIATGEKGQLSYRVRVK